MDGSYQQIGELITRVRARWRRLLFFRAAVTRRVDRGGWS